MVAGQGGLVEPALRLLIRNQAGGQVQTLAQLLLLTESSF